MQELVDGTTLIALKIQISSLRKDVLHRLLKLTKVTIKQKLIKLIQPAMDVAGIGHNS